VHGLKFIQFACMQHLYKCTYMQSACVWKQFGLHLCKLITSSMHANECMHSTSVQHSCNSHPCSQNVCSTCAVRMCAVHSCIAHINNLHICCTESSIYATCVLQLKIFVRDQSTNIIYLEQAHLCMPTFNNRNQTIQPLNI